MGAGAFQMRGKGRGWVLVFMLHRTMARLPAHCYGTANPLPMPLLGMRHTACGIACGTACGIACGTARQLLGLRTLPVALPVALLE